MKDFTSGRMGTSPFDDPDRDAADDFSSPLLPSSASQDYDTQHPLQQEDMRVTGADVEDYLQVVADQKQSLLDPYWDAIRTSQANIQEYKDNGDTAGWLGEERRINKYRRFIEEATKERINPLIPPHISQGVNFSLASVITKLKKIPESVAKELGNGGNMMDRYYSIVYNATPFSYLGPFTDRFIHKDNKIIPRYVFEPLLFRVKDSKGRNYYERMSQGIETLPQSVGRFSKVPRYQIMDHRRLKMAATLFGETAANLLRYSAPPNELGTPNVPGTQSENDYNSSNHGYSEYDERDADLFDPNDDESINLARSGDWRFRSPELYLGHPAEMRNPPGFEDFEPEDKLESDNPYPGMYHAFDMLLFGLSHYAAEKNPAAYLKNPVLDVMQPGAAKTVKDRKMYDIMMSQLPDMGFIYSKPGNKIGRIADKSFVDGYDLPDEKLPGRPVEDVELIIYAALDAVPLYSMDDDELPGAYEFNLAMARMEELLEANSAIQRTDNKLQSLFGRSQALGVLPYSVLVADPESALAGDYNAIKRIWDMNSPKELPFEDARNLVLSSITTRSQAAKLVAFHGRDPSSLAAQRQDQQQPKGLQIGQSAPQNSDTTNPSESGSLSAEQQEAMERVNSLTSELIAYGKAIGEYAVTTLVYQQAMDGCLASQSMFLKYIQAVDEDAEGLPLLNITLSSDASHSYQSPATGNSLANQSGQSGQSGLTNQSTTNQTNQTNSANQDSIIDCIVGDDGEAIPLDT